MPETPKEPVEALDPETKRIIDEGIGAFVDLLKAYQRIHGKAERGERITGKDFTEAEQRTDTVWNASDLGLVDISDEHIQAYIAQKRAEALKQSPSLISDALEVDALHKAFFRQYLSAPNYQENTRLEASTQTERELVEDVLSKNRGFALADMHSEEESLKFLTRHMALVDTIYHEFPSIIEFDHLTANELRQIAKEGKYKDRIFGGEKEVAEQYGVERADNIPAALFEMMAEAKEHDVRLVYIDKENKIAREVETSNHRITSTNFIWTDNVFADRVKLAKEGKGDGKFVVFGGGHHFTSDATDHRYGLVDEGLGIPVIAYERADKNKPVKFRRSTDPSEADFYLPGGEDYIELQKSIPKTPPDSGKNK